MPIDTESNLDNLCADIVVIGAGGAGLAAAVAAAEKGAKVIILEKRQSPGGNSAKAFGLFAAESSIQNRLNFRSDRDFFFQTIVDYSHWRITPDIVNAYINKSADTIEWLKEKDISFDLPQITRQVFQVTIPPVCHYPLGYGVNLIKILAKKFTELGGRILCDTTAKQILSDNNGQISAVVASHDKVDLNISTRKIIIATGGFAGNKDMLTKYCPYYKNYMTLAGIPNTGDGLELASSKGANTEGLGILLADAKGVSPSNPDLFNLAIQPVSIWIDNNGERFVDEAAGTLYESSNAAFRLKNCINFTLIDENIINHISQHGFYNGISVSLPPNSDIPDFHSILRKAADNGAAIISNSLSDIADWMRISADTLSSTVNKYNYDCTKGRDSLFLKNPDYLLPLKNPPYYAIICVPQILTTMGGIKINSKMQVLDRQDNPISGLFAAGADVGGWEPDTFSLWLMTPLSGFLFGYSFGFAINSGRIAGEFAST